MKLLSLSLLLAACAAPATSVKTADSRPGLAIEGAAAGSQLFLDGSAVGSATAFDGRPSVLRVEPGTHEIEVRDSAGRVLFRQKVFVESETKTIVVH